MNSIIGECTPCRDGEANHVGAVQPAPRQCGEFEVCKRCSALLTICVPSYVRKDTAVRWRVAFLRDGKLLGGVSGVLEMVQRLLYCGLKSSMSGRGLCGIQAEEFLPGTRSYSTFCASSQNATADAAATLRESTPWAIGMRTT